MIWWLIMGVIGLVTAAILLSGEIIPPGQAAPEMAKEEGDDLD